MLFNNLKHTLKYIHKLDYYERHLHDGALIDPYAVFILCDLMIQNISFDSNPYLLDKLNALTDIGFVNRGTSHFRLTSLGQMFVAKYLPHYRLILAVQKIAILVKQIFWVIMIALYSYTWIHFINNDISNYLIALIMTGFFVYLSLGVWFLVIMDKIMWALPLDCYFLSKRASLGALICFLLNNFSSWHPKSKDTDYLEDQIRYRLFLSRTTNVRLRTKNFISDFNVIMRILY